MLVQGYIWYRSNLVACKLYIGDIPNLSICQIHSQCSYHLFSCVEAIMKVQAWMVVNIMHMNIFYDAEKNQRAIFSMNRKQLIFYMLQSADQLFLLAIICTYPLLPHKHNREHNESKLSGIGTRDLLDNIKKHLIISWLGHFYDLIAAW